MCFLEDLSFPPNSMFASLRRISTQTGGGQIGLRHFLTSKEEENLLTIAAELLTSIICGGEENDTLTQKHIGNYQLLFAVKLSVYTWYY